MFFFFGYLEPSRDNVILRQDTIAFLPCGRNGTSMAADLRNKFHNLDLQGGAPFTRWRPSYKWVYGGPYK